MNNNFFNFYRYLYRVLAGIAQCATSLAWADGVGVENVYSPYVEVMETEIEYRTLAYADQQNKEVDIKKHQLALGRSVTEHWFAEAYITGVSKDQDAISLDGYALESKVQLTEQGEYDWDVGALFEIESENHERTHEFSTALLLATEVQKTLFTTNLILIIEDLPDQPIEMETAINSQWRWRLNPLFEPGIECYYGQFSSAIGPVITGDWRMGLRKKLHWEAGYLFETRHDVPDHVVRTMVEFEF